MNKDQLKAAFAKGARIQAWHLLPGATNSNQGQWDTLTPADGARPEFGCEAHLYRVHPEDLSLIAELGQEVGAVEPAWFYVRTPGADYDYTFTKTREEAIDLQDCDEPDEPIPLYTSPAHTSEARDAELLTYKEIVRRLASTREGCLALAKVVHRELDFIDKCITDAIARCESDAAMRQEGGE